MMIPGRILIGNQQRCDRRGRCRIAAHGFKHNRAWLYADQLHLFSNEEAVIVATDEEWRSGAGQIGP